MHLSACGKWSPYFVHSIQVTDLGFLRLQQHQKNELDKRMMSNVQQAMKDSEAMLAVIDAAHKPLQDLAGLQPGPDWSGPPLAMVR